ncbi:MAG: rRNA maturation RNase YbeY [Bacilli bacterium]|jgi:probable rRNA maturation factor
MEFEFINHMGAAYDRYRPEFLKLLKKTLRQLEMTDEVIVEVSLVDNESIKRLNRDYRGQDRETDVISFAFQDAVVGETSIKEAPFLDLGAIVISTPKAEAQAEAYGHSLDREMAFLFIHGLLHLCGYDHQNPNEEERMFALQDAIIGKREIYEKR